MEASVGRPDFVVSEGRRRRIVDRPFEIEFLGPGVQAFAFTFG
jgi:hypothetical protein